MWAEINEVLIPETLEEKQLWHERAVVEKKIERKEKMIHNAKERLKSGWVPQEQRLNDEMDEIQAEIDWAREEMTGLDRRIRAAEKSGEENGSEWEKWEAKAKYVAAKQAKRYSQALGQARKRRDEEERRISELEAKLKSVGGMVGGEER